MTYFEIMGVMNITPNSFSDGGIFLSEESILRGLHQLSQSCDILDIGAESTAPMNVAIGAEEERVRLENFLGYFSIFLKNYSFKRAISLDSFRPENVFWFFEELKKLGLSETSFYWNDVSGQWDDKVEKFLKDYNYSSYIYCHNLAPTRELCGRHMDYVLEGANVGESLVSFFSTKFPSNTSIEERVFFDPCFGFSKTAEQNLWLLENWEYLFEKLPYRNWVIGISKKSFLRSWWKTNMPDSDHLTREGLLEKSEFLHLSFLESFLQKAKTHLVKGTLSRVHNPELAILAKQRILTT